MELIVEKSLEDKNFMVGAYIGEHICDSIIEWIDLEEKKGNAKPGMIIGQEAKYEGTVNRSVKDSIDIALNYNKDLFLLYGDELRKVTEYYISEYEMCNKGQQFGINDYVNVQKYYPDGGYHKWHFERQGASNRDLVRHLVFMTYLNDVEEGGETEWLYQNFKIKPKKGLTVIWPADWTFTHRGLTTVDETKYIVTGWLNYIMD